MSYWRSPWPGEDGGPGRRQAPHGAAGLGLRDGEALKATSRDAFGANMVVLRAPGEVFLQGSTMGPASTAWVERIHPTTLAPIARSPELPAGPFWPAGVAAHANGSLYVTCGRWCHRLAADCSVIASRELPQARPYNSLLILPGGCLVMKDFIRDGSDHSRLVVLDPERLEPVGPEIDVPEASIARISADGAMLYVVGDHTVFRFQWDEPARRLAIDPSWRARYRTLEGQTFGWDAVLAGGWVWFQDNGEGTERFAGTLRGAGVSDTPLHLVRVPIAGDGSRVQLVEVCGRPGGIIANPPLVDVERRIALAYDTGNGVLAAFRFDDERLTPLWQRAQDHGGHMIHWPDTGEVLTFDHTGGVDHAVVLDLETGAEKGRVATGSPVQSVVFPAVGWGREAYYCSFMTVARIAP